jgi:DNA-binding CsgD family transcriptional regulator
LRDEDGAADEAEVVPRAEAERIIRGLRAEDVARVAYRAAAPSMAANVIGRAVLDLKSGEVEQGWRCEGEPEGLPGEDNLVTLIECDAAAGVLWDYSRLSLLSEGERAELEARLEAERESRPTAGMARDGEAYDLRYWVGTDGVPRYLREKGESAEQREEEAFVRSVAAEPWPDWDAIRARLDRVYGPAAGPVEEPGESEGAGEVLRRLEAYGSRLEERERRVLESDYGLGDAPPASYGEIARDLGLSVEQVRQTRLRAERRVGFGREGGAEILGLLLERSRLLREREDAGREMEAARARLSDVDRRLARLDEDPLMAEVPGR